MTQRERLEPSTRAHATDRSAVHAPALRTETVVDSARASSWEDAFLGASNTQQHELLDLFHRQGILYSHQIPPTSKNSTDHGLHLLTRLLGGHIDEISPVHPKAIQPFDADLDPTQREAIAKAMQTPDLCLIQGLPGTGKSRVAAEIALQAAARGERVLLLSTTSQANDRVLELIGNCDQAFPIRCVTAGDGIDQVPPSSIRFLYSEQLRRLREEPIKHAREQSTRADECCVARRRQEPVFQRLQGFAARQQELEKQIDIIRNERERVPKAVEIEANNAGDRNTGANGDFASAVADSRKKTKELLTSLEDRAKDVQGKTDQISQEKDRVTLRLDAVRPLAEARQAKRWWSGAWWRALFQGDVCGELSQCDVAAKQAANDLDLLKSEAEELRQERAKTERDSQAEHQARLESEIARRVALCDDRETAARNEQAVIRDNWQSACLEIDSATRPPALTTEAVEIASAQWKFRLDEEVRRADSARKWIQCLEEAEPTLPRRIFDYVNVVAATTRGLFGDEHFGDDSNPLLTFDLMILQEADHVTKTEFLTLARRARRWVLIGEPNADVEPKRSSEPIHPAGENGDREKKPLEKGKTVLTPVSSLLALRPGFFEQLWQRLHCDPRRLPYLWFLENKRLCCRLRPVLHEQRQWIESECVADFPEIELRILALPMMAPVLAEVVFPPSMSIYKAKEYIYKELEELALWAPGQSLCWVEEPDKLVLRMADASWKNAAPLVLEPGVREFVVTLPANADLSATQRWFTCGIEFDREAGWDRPRAETWIHHHLGVHDLGRTARFDVPYRMHPELADFLSELLFAGEYRVARGEAAARGFADSIGFSTNGTPTLVEFIGVGVSKQDDRRDAKYAAKRPGQTKKGGAGLELDLTDKRHRDRLPSELRGDLPDAGLVNFLEAQAVVKKLQSLASDPIVAAAVAASSQRQRPRPLVAVAALYPAQAELIRRLVRDCPKLQSTGFDLEIGVPSAFRQREALVLLVSLTRSHSHRAVSYGDSPDALTLALTRVRAKLILFGDPGTMSRRVQWDDVVDHLDPGLASRERNLIGQLVQYLDGQGPHQRVFHLYEGDGK